VASRNIKWLVALMSLVTGATLHAAPTIGDSNAKISQALLSYSDRGKACDSEVSLLSGTADTALAKVAVDILKPPAGFINPSALPPGARPLPAVPAALFMGLTGFLCVTLVRDRKAWLAGIAFLLWAGQTGFAALPQAVSHLIERRQFSRYSQQQYRNSALQERTSRLRSDLEGTEYISLLHHLEGIPTKIRNTKNDIRHTIYEAHIVFSYLIRAFNCLPLEVRRFFCFSPAFIFESIPRGPPKLVLTKSYLTRKKQSLFIYIYLC
jgi:hypothetical protein